MPKNNTFYSTVAGNNYVDISNVDVVFQRAIYDRDLDPVVMAQLQIGSKLFPEYPIQSSQEAYYMLRKSIKSFGIKYITETCAVNKTYEHTI